MLWVASKRPSALTIMLKRHVIHRLVGDFAIGTSGRVWLRLAGVWQASERLWPSGRLGHVWGTYGHAWARLDV
jgi:hypothetical protein